MHNLLCLILNGPIRESLESVEVFSVIVAGLGHDVGHPGLTNRHLISTQDSLSILYNDHSILEHMHCSTIFKLLSSPDCDIFKNFSNNHFFRCRKLIIEMILSTDLLRHFEILGKFRSRAILMQDLNLNIEEDRTVALSMALKCADLGFTSKSLSLHKRWIDLWTEEIFAQGDLEQYSGQQFSTYFSREGNSQSKSVCCLIRNICLPMFEVFGEWLDNKICKEVIIYQAEKNLEHWDKVRIQAKENDF